jgi:hypothetical protein
MRARYSVGETGRGDLGYEITDEEVQGRSIDRQALYMNNAVDFRNGAKLRSNFRLSEQSSGTETTLLSGLSTLDWPLEYGFSSLIPWTNSTQKPRFGISCTKA